MKKLSLEIERCDDCPYVEYLEDVGNFKEDDDRPGYICNHPDMKRCNAFIMSEDDWCEEDCIPIPAHCPLPNKED